MLLACLIPTVIRITAYGTAGLSSTQIPVLRNTVHLQPQLKPKGVEEMPRNLAQEMPRNLGGSVPQKVSFWHTTLYIHSPADTENGLFN